MPQHFNPPSSALEELDLDPTAQPGANLEDHEFELQEEDSEYASCEEYKGEEAEFDSCEALGESDGLPSVIAPARHREGESDSHIHMAVGAEAPPEPGSAEAEASLIVHRGALMPALASSSAYDPHPVVEPEPEAIPHTPAPAGERRVTLVIDRCDPFGEARSEDAPQSHRVRFNAIRTRKYTAKEHETDSSELEQLASPVTGEEDSSESDSDSCSPWHGPGNGHGPDDADGSSGSAGSAGLASAPDAGSSVQTPSPAPSQPAPSPGAAASGKQLAIQPLQPGDSTIALASMLAAHTPGSADGGIRVAAGTGTGHPMLDADWFDSMPVAALALGGAVAGYMLGFELSGATVSDCQFALPAPDLFAGWIA